ncbi:hypothetical protein FDP41_000595 [Naegleria fowleri]|uniref:Uncharacterized protein n=1 Tax=Naegleria fowleri TaxID=5763 RepID=A0A6A5CAC3_NAEFO|nr:uncharacterized protein FDP41_000595 [Naegleria fowleri]KAF0984696.1 hypothetical protein FDP41_000595 [Naegleria fowleri]
MMRFNISLLVVVIALVALLASSSSCFAQQCKNRKTFADPTACTSCTFCTATKSSSCCTAAEDSAASLAASVGQLVSTGCYDLMKMGACAICDPKNQQFVNENGTLVVCKSACQRVVSACGLTSVSCDSMPTTNCWSGALSVVMLWKASLVFMVMMIGVVFML